MKLRIIDWEDSTSLVGGVWRNKKHAKSLKPDMIRSVGYVIKETKRSIVLASHISSGELSGEMCIPKSAIRRMKKKEK